MDGSAITDPRGARAPIVQAVAIGASAGGIDALKVVLSALPANARASLFVVLHLPPSRPSMLAEVLAPHTALRVLEAIDKLPIEAGTVYLAPPDYHMLTDDGPQLALSTDPAVNYSRPAIDVLFESAADLYGVHLAGVVLTGANDDGARGLAAIGRAGGLMLVQEPSTALVSTMPGAAIERCPEAHVMELPAMARLLAQLCKEETA